MFLFFISAQKKIMCEKSNEWYCQQGLTFAIMAMLSDRGIGVHQCIDNIDVQVWVDADSITFRESYSEELGIEDVVVPINKIETVVEVLENYPASNDPEFRMNLTSFLDVLRTI